MDVLDTALASYPAEQALIESKAALGQLAMQIRLSEFFESANSAADSGDLAGARKILRDALYYLGRQQGGREVDEWAEQIRGEIVQLDIELDGPRGPGPVAG
jgi:hypothetical protein